jgi:hypothetical protein
VRRQEIRTFATTTPGLLELRDWLAVHEVTVVGMKATGSYWKPVYHLMAPFPTAGHLASWPRCVR